MKPDISFGPFIFPTFYIVITLTVIILLLVLDKHIQLKPQFSKLVAIDLAMIMMVFGFFGARLTHIFYEEPQYYLYFPEEIYKFWKGGFVYYGGFLFAFFGCVVYLKSRKENILKWADFFTPYVSLSYAFGRLGCFFEGCCYGKYCNLPWAVAHKHPTQLYMMLGELTLIASFLLLQKKQQNLFNKFNQNKNAFSKVGSFFKFWLLGHCILRFIIEFYRDDDRGQFLFNLSISQWVSLIILSGVLISFKAYSTEE